MAKEKLLTTRAALALVILALNAVIMAIAAWILLTYGRNTTQVQLFVMIVFFSFVAAVVTFILFQTASAEATGQIYGINFKIVGPLAALLIVFGVLWGVAPKPETRVVRAILINNGKQVQGQFSLTPTAADTDLPRKTSENNEIRWEIPSHIDQFDSVILDMVGYQLQDDPPYKIEGSYLRIKVIPTEIIPELGPGEKPNPSVFHDLPKRDAVNLSSAVKPGDHTLEYRNATTQPLRLLILDVCRYYEAIEKNEPGQAYWLDFPFNPRADFEGYDHFDRTDGTHCFAVMDKDRHVYPLLPTSVKNVCKAQVSKLTVTSPATGKFEAKWE